MTPPVDPLVVKLRDLAKCWPSWSGLLTQAADAIEVRNETNATLRAQLAARDAEVRGRLEQAARWHDEQFIHYRDAAFDSNYTKPARDFYSTRSKFHHDSAAALRALSPDATPTAPEREKKPRGTPTPWPGKCGHCGFITDATACPRCGLWGGINYEITSAPVSGDSA